MEERSHGDGSSVLDTKWRADGKMMKERSHGDGSSVLGTQWRAEGKTMEPSPWRSDTQHKTGTRGEDTSGQTPKAKGQFICVCF